jgi:hypothetical protein
LTRVDGSSYCLIGVNSWLTRNSGRPFALNFPTDLFQSLGQAQLALQRQLGFVSTSCWGFFRLLAGWSCALIGAGAGQRHVEIFLETETNGP